ncbi:helix-turn-helix domain-containing protein [Solimonas terrae]|uniref:Helix-turn-helix transcriptional regulator n=1 Tax=Solimonas terrae TaxID=1396819 RepID=A0A6M2BWB9_9GAMM|nr:helix-turn-helix transcriptional regulator [Solimonas terrae]NGY06694.1 helix-turn-helix transcriptional regulator [Solimonas terrae]
MSDIASLLKSEISRLSKKTIRQHLGPVQAATSSHRHQLAALKKQIAQLEQEVKKLRRVAGSATPQKLPAEGVKLRFVAKGLKSLRSRLGLSAEDLGALLGVSGQSVYNWESKKTVPRASQVAAIAKLRGLGKRDAQAQLEILAAKPAKPAKADKPARKKAKVAAAAPA